MAETNPLNDELELEKIRQLSDGRWIYDVFRDGVNVGRIYPYQLSPAGYKPHALVNTEEGGQPTSKRPSWPAAQAMGLGIVYSRRKAAKAVAEIYDAVRAERLTFNRSTSRWEYRQ